MGEEGMHNKALLLKFVTGNERLPVGGFADLSTKFLVSLDSIAERNALPKAHSCFNELVLSGYDSVEILEQKLLVSCTMGIQFGIV